MKLVNIQNLTLQFDTTGNVDDGLIITMIELINTTLSDIHPTSQPQIVIQKDMNVKVIDLI